MRKVSGRTNVEAGKNSSAKPAGQKRGQISLDINIEVGGIPLALEIFTEESKFLHGATLKHVTLTHLVNLGWDFPKYKRP